MAAVVRVSAPDFTEAAASVAQHLGTAAMPPRAAIQSPVAASPVDAAARAAAGAIQAKMATMSAQLAPKGPEMQQAAGSGAAALTAQDAANSARMPSVPGVPTPSASGLHAGGSGGGAARARPINWLGQQPTDSPQPVVASLSDLPQMSIRCIDIRVMLIPNANFRCFVTHDDGSIEVFLSP